MPVPPRTLARMMVLVLMKSDDGPWEVGFSVRIVGSPFFFFPPPASSSSAFYSVGLQEFRRGEGERMLPIDFFWGGRGVFRKKKKCGGDSGNVD